MGNSYSLHPPPSPPEEDTWTRVGDGCTYRYVSGHWIQSYCPVVSLPFNVDGILRVGEDVAPVAVPAERLFVYLVHARVKTAPRGRAIVLDINQAGTSIFANQANRPTIADGQLRGDSGPPDTQVIERDDSITLDIDQVGAGVAGRDLSVSVRCRPCYS